MYDFESSDPCYWRLYLTKSEVMTVVCMQSFDEYDYDQNKFFKHESGESMRFETEDAAVHYLNKHFKPEFIDPEYLSPNSFKFMLKNE